MRQLRKIVSNASSASGVTTHPGALAYRKKRRTVALLGNKTAPTAPSANAGVTGTGVRPAALTAAALETRSSWTAAPAGDADEVDAPQPDRVEELGKPRDQLVGRRPPISVLAGSANEVRSVDPESRREAHKRPEDAGRVPAPTVQRRAERARSLEWEGRRNMQSLVLQT